MGDAKKDPISCALSIMRRMPPNKIEHNLSGLLNLVPEHTDELLQRVDQPLEEATCAESGRKYLLCDYNRDGDSYRSPWSNAYEPPLDDGFVPSAKLRALEVEANALFDAYRELYFEGGGTSSVYLWDLDGGFAGCFLIKKGVSGHEFVSTGAWDSIHVVEVAEASDGRATYKLTTTVMLSMDVHKPAVGDSNLSGSLTRMAEKACAVDEAHPHVANIGSMIEDMETDIRTYLDSLYIQKTREVDQQNVSTLPPALLEKRTLAAFAARAAARVEHTVVADGDGVVGFAVALPDGNEMEQLFVDARPAAAALALLAAAEARLPGPTLFLVAVPENARAIRFYEKHGWVRAGRVTYDAEVEAGVAFPLRLLRLEKTRARPAR
ncbi:hypothetical protein JL721_1048 [Aureococcus anophagefferens]|nr:hypothetical protein JL721_1048 [Aureococcus anophagefferens]